MKSQNKQAPLFHEFFEDIDQEKSEEKPGDQTNYPIIPLPILEGTHSLGPDMKFGWKPEVKFESAPIPLYFNFIENPHQNFYEEQAYYQNTGGKVNNFKIIYYGPRFKDSFEMHKNFVKPADNTYEFGFPKFYGLASAKAFYDSVFEDMMDGEAPRKDEMREFQGMSPDVDRNELNFNSNFENGNLDMVVKTADDTYDLFLRVDTNTRGHTNWFHFEVSKTKKYKTVTFNIVNMSKKDALFNHGMLINYWSQKRNSPNFCGWERGGTNIRYQRTPGLKQNQGYRQRKYYTLSFDFKFDHENDKVWFAYTIPYSYSMCVQYIKSIIQEQKAWLNIERVKEREWNQNLGNMKPFRKRGKVIQDSVLCKTLSGVEVPLLTITNFEDQNWQKTKKIIFIQSRIHPGETASSWIVHGLISFLISRSKVAEQLRKRFVFKIIPMLNPDGVIIGNSRATLLGVDMNRQFLNNEDQDPKLNPVPIAIKDLIASLIREERDKIVAFMDLHQHSKKKCIFIYGPYYPLHNDKYLQIRIIPKLLSERSEFFRFFSSRFRIDKYKENCARITIGKEFNIVNCFTLECSCFGYITKDRNTVQFRESDLIEFGKSLAECVLEYDMIMEKDRQTKFQIKERILQKKKTRKTIREILGDQGKKASEEKLIEIKKDDDELSDDESDDSDFNESGSEEEEEFADYKLDKVDDNFQQPLLPDLTVKTQNEAEVDSQDDDDEDKFYSDEEEEGNQSPVEKPNDIKGLLKHKQKRTKFDLKGFSASDFAGRTGKIRTLDQLLNMIQTDIIHEESDDDSNPSIGSNSSDGDAQGSDSSGDDNLDDQDQEILRDRILHAIQVFSKWSPNPKKEILKQKRGKKLSIENRSLASSKRSNKSDSKKSISIAEMNEIQFPFSKEQIKQIAGGKLNSFRKQNKQQKKDVIDNFLREFSAMQNQSQNQGGQGIDNNSMLHDLDDEVISSISNEILKQKRKIVKKKQKNQGNTGKSSAQGDLLMVKSFGTNKGKKNNLGLNSGLNSQDYFQKIDLSKAQMLTDNSGNTKSNSVVVGSARKVILLKYQTTQEKIFKAGEVSADQRSQTPIELQSLRKIDYAKPIKVQISQIDGKLQTQYQAQQLKIHEIMPSEQKTQNITPNRQQLNYEVPKNSHLLGYENKLALLNEAIINKKRQKVSQNEYYSNYNELRKSNAKEPAFQRPQTSLARYQQNRALNKYIQQKSQNNSTHSSIIQIPTLSMAHQNNILHQQHSLAQRTPNNGQNASFDSVQPPFFSCQIHPQPNLENLNSQKQRRNFNHKKQISSKVNVATDMSPKKFIQIQESHNNLHEISQMSHTINQEPVFYVKEQDNLKQGSMENDQKHSTQTVSENSVPMLMNNQNDQRQILSSQSKQYQVVLNVNSKKIENDELSSVYQSDKKVKFKTQITEKSIKQQTNLNKDQSLQEYLDSQSIGLHQWMRLQQEGHLPQKFPTNQMIVSNTARKQKAKTQSDFTQIFAADKQFSNVQLSQTRKSDLYKSQNFTQKTSPTQTLLNFSGKQTRKSVQFNEKNIKEILKNEHHFIKDGVSREKKVNQKFQKFGQIAKGRPQSMMEVRNQMNSSTNQSANDSESIHINNSYQMPSTRYRPFVNQIQKQNALNYIEQNKTQIVREILLKSGGKYLGRPDVVYNSEKEFNMGYNIRQKTQVKVQINQTPVTPIIYDHDNKLEQTHINAHINPVY